VVFKASKPQSTYVFYRLFRLSSSFIKCKQAKERMKINMSKQKKRIVTFVLTFVMIFTSVLPMGLLADSYEQYTASRVFSFDIFNNGEGGSPSRPHSGLASSGIIRM